MQVTFTCNALKGTNKVGDLHPDKDGYRRVIMAEFDAESRNGTYYPFEAAKKFFTESSAFMRMVNSNDARGETGHPEFLPGMTKGQYFNRIATIMEKHICHQFRNITLDDTISKNPNGEPRITVLADVIPSGVGFEYLERQFANPKENVSFSLRAFSQDRMIQGVLHRELVELFTFDNVNEGGFETACKYHSPALESLHANRPGVEHTFNLDEIIVEPTIDRVALESAQRMRNSFTVTANLEPRSATYIYGSTKPVFLRF